MGIRKIFSRFRGDESGAIAVWVGLSMPMVLGIGALAFDMNNMYVTKAQLQHTADASAIAAARALPDESAAVAAAQSYANLNMPSATHGTVVSSNDVEPGNWDPDAGVFTPSGTPLNAVRVAARRDQQNGNPMPTSIGATLGVSSVNVSASTIAAQSAGGAGGCIMALHMTMQEAFHMHGTAVVRTSFCDIQVNSSHATEAMLASGQSLVQIEANTGNIRVKGGVMETGPALFDPTPMQDEPPINDPYASVNFPAVGSCDHTNFTSTNDVTLTPGVYCGGIQITGSGTATFTGGGVNNGQYIIKDGELFVAGTMAAVTDFQGVTFFLTGVDANVNFAGTADIGLTAATGGNYAGFVFFGDRNNPASDPHVLRGTELGGYNGKIYLPGASALMVGTADGTLGSSDCTVLIAESLVFNGTPVFEAAQGCSAYGGAGASTAATIVK